jgi:hypothetical protein
MLTNINLFLAQWTVCFPLQPILDAHFVEHIVATLDGIPDIALQFLLLADVGVYVLATYHAFDELGGWLKWRRFFYRNLILLLFSD